MRSWLRTSTAIVGLAGLYFCAGKVGLSLAFVHASASAVWPPTGIAFAALLLWGYRLWPAIFLGAFLVNITTQGSLATSLAIAAGNTLEALLGAWAVNRFANGAKVFERAKNIFKFILLAPILSTVVSATIGVTSLTLGGFAPWKNYTAIWFTWWLGDAVGDLIVAPLLVLWLTQPVPKISVRRTVEAIGLLLSIIFVSYLMFQLGTPASSEYAMVLPLLWAAFRFGPRGVVTAAFIVSAITLIGTLNGVGAFAHADPNASLLHLQSFMGTIEVAALVLASVIAEARHSEQRLVVQAALSRILAESPAIEEAAIKFVQVLCDQAGWDLGVIWNVGRATDQLRFVELWHTPAVNAAEFETFTRDGPWTSSTDLTVRVWQTGKALWVADLAAENSANRAQIAVKNGLHSAIGFPIKVGSRTLGVIECYSREAREPDENFLQMVSDIGGQLGQFVERKRAEDLLLESEERLRAVVETAVDGIITIDEEGIINTVNSAAERIFDYPAAALIGQNVRMLMAEPYRSEHDSYIGNYLRTGDRKIIGIGREVLGRRQDGTDFPLDLAVSESFVNGQRHFTGIVRDISERKRADDLLRATKDELVKINENLERRVQERTADLAQANAVLQRTLEEQKQLEEQLRQAQKMESIGTLAGGIAHDFNNILNIIRGYAMLIGQQPSGDPQVQTSLRVIDQEIDRGATVVQQLMTVARKSETRLVRVDVKDIVSNVSQLIKTFPKTIDVSLELDQSATLVLADANKMAQALLNICVNAQDAMPMGGKLTLTTSRIEANRVPDYHGGADVDMLVCIAISDTGEGMPANVRDRIFEPFFTTKGVGKGTGLGLAIVYGIMKEHNGHVEVESAVGRGTTFRLYLPLLRSAGSTTTAQPTQADSAQKPTQGRGTVMVVEDEENLVRLLEKLLPRAGYRVLTAMDGEQAIDLYSRHQTEIDFVLLDLGLPKITGVHVMAKLIEQNPRVKIVVTTGYLTADLKSELFQAGVKECIRKPYFVDNIVHTLGTL
jgi:PAS domain S-box-containing protein